MAESLRPKSSLEALRNRVKKTFRLRGIASSLEIEGIRVARERLKTILENHGEPSRNNKHNK